MAKKSLLLVSPELETIRELSDQESALIGGGTRYAFNTCNHRMSRRWKTSSQTLPRRYLGPDGTWGSTCVYDEPALPILNPRTPIH